MIKALITGVTGQDGSYLAELLLSKGYEVYGFKRRSSVDNTERLVNVVNNEHFHMEYGDITDPISVFHSISTIKPDEVYNLAAMSHVAYSFREPVHTFNVVAGGCVNMLEAIKQMCFPAKLYQASSSEMFGSSIGDTNQQDESTPFHPESPYAIAKATAHYATGLYRRAYGLHASCGILFNHECVVAETPLIVRSDDIVDIIQAKDLISVKGGSSPYGNWNKRQRTIDNMEIWDGEQWTILKFVSATRIKRDNPDHKLINVVARGGNIIVTKHHRMLDQNYNTIAAGNLNVGDKVAIGKFPTESKEFNTICPKFAEFLGLLVSDGYVAEKGNLRFTNTNIDLIKYVKKLYYELFNTIAKICLGRSGKGSINKIYQLNMHGNTSLGRYIRSLIYTKDGYKKVPKIIFNSSIEIRENFIKGYYAGDGLKAGNSIAFSSNSCVLIQGLLLLYAMNGYNNSSIYCDKNEIDNWMYKVNMRSLSNKGQHLVKDSNEIRKILKGDSEYEWVFDIETESSIFMGGVGKVVVHNSPRRGENFVTRKITRYAAQLYHAKTHRHTEGFPKLKLGNLDAFRDWGHAKDYVQAMWLMMQQEKPDDYIIATGKTHSVRQLLELAFGYIKEDYNNWVEVDEALKRPSEVPYLCGNASKAHSVLGWAPKVSFEELIYEMVYQDILSEYSKKKT